MNDEPTDRRRGTPVLVAAAALAGLFAALGAASAWSGSQDATGSEIVARIGRLGPGCRPIAEETLRRHLLDKGEPLTRDDLDDAVDDLHQCEKMDEQMRGLGVG